MEPIISIFPLGDSAVTFDLGQHMDEGLNDQVLVLGDHLKAHPFPGLYEVLVSYSSVSLFYDPELIRPLLSSDDTDVYGFVRKRLELAWNETVRRDHARREDGTGIRKEAALPKEIPVCYEAAYGPDLEEIARKKGLAPEDLVRLHCQTIYRVYMIGFLPGFPYMGKTDDRLRVPRKDRPMLVPAGGVGIAGNQTGIYPLDSPGGWQVIGRTPLRMFDPAKDPPVRLYAGDSVRFFPISAADFRNWDPGVGF